MWDPPTFAFTSGGSPFTQLMRRAVPFVSLPRPLLPAQEFRPRLTPKQVIRAGTWGGCYFHPRGGKPGIKHPQGVKIDHKEFPKSWFEGLPQR